MCANPDDNDLISSSNVSTGQSNDGGIIIYSAVVVVAEKKLRQIKNLQPQASKPILRIYNRGTIKAITRHSPVPNLC